MTRSSRPAPQDDFETIQAAVLETARGRWFLNEFARRIRAADTAMLLEAIDRLESAMRNETARAKETDGAAEAIKKAEDEAPGAAVPDTEGQQPDGKSFEGKILYFS